MATEDIQPGFGQSQDYRPGMPFDTSNTPASLDEMDRQRSRALGRAGTTLGAQRLARGLGVFGIGIGVAQLLAPRAVARFIGMDEHTAMIRACGIREVATGVGILRQRNPAPWLWARVAGDAMDMALLSAALRQGNPGRNRAMGAMAAVAGVTVLDALCARQLSMGEGRSMLQGMQGRMDMQVRHSVSINRAPQECYEFWRNFENLPRFMEHLESVKVLDDKLSHWVVKGPAGTRVEWDAEVTDERPGEYISWRSREGADVPNAGTVQFQPAPAGRGTIVHASIHYSPPAGKLGSAVARLFREEPHIQVREDLRRFKQVMETGEVSTTDGQPSGKRSLLGRVSRSGGASREQPGWTRASEQQSSSLGDTQTPPPPSAH